MTDQVNEAVAFAVELPDGSVSEFGWQDMRTFKHAQRIAVLGEGCRYVFAYHPSRGVVDEAIDERASFEADYLRRFNAPGRLGMNAEGCYGHLMTRCRFEGWQARAALQAAALPADRCPNCDDTGDVHRADGEWVGSCKCPAALPAVPAFDMLAHLQRQREWSGRTFGPGPRTAGVIDHIRKELREIEADPTDLSEWIDVVILALDGAWRAGGTPEQIIATLVAKQTKNEGRTWPDWRTSDPDKAIEHDRAQDTHPLRGVVDEVAVTRLAKHLGRRGGPLQSYNFDACLMKAREYLQAAQPAVPPVPDSAWRSASQPPCGKPHQWSVPVAALTISGDVFRVSYMHGDELGSGVWQRLRAMADLGVGGAVVAWTPIPTTSEIESLAATPAHDRHLPNPCEIGNKSVDATTPAHDQPEGSDNG